MELNFLLVRLYIDSGCCEYYSSQQSLWTELSLLFDGKYKIKTDLKIKVNL